MIKEYYEENGKLINRPIIPSENPMIHNGSWIELTSPTPEEIAWIQTTNIVPAVFIKSGLDEEETAHNDVEDDARLVVIDVPLLDGTSANKFSYTTTPFSIIHTPNNLVTISLRDTDLVKDFLLKNKRIEPHKRVRFTLLLLYRLAVTYITYLRKIDTQTKEVEKELHHSMRNKELFDLMELNKSLVYFSTALNANKVVVQKLARTDEFKQYEDDFELLDDTVIEINQAIEMCSVYRDINAGMMDAFASIISNNLNIVMKALAVITIVLSVPTLVASFFGMNFTFLPLEDHPWGFTIAIIVSFVLSILSAIVLYRYTKKIK